MDERSDVDKLDEIMLPGFRFHPTDEELVGFYLKRKVQQRPLSIELIKQLDIYKYDPWDLPKLATIGEKEWYFYCPRDRKYRNSNRPNRVTGAGFWKATGTDRPIYSSEGSKCIGLKKSLVFYKGRAAKGTKTDWMMHEFRLPTLCDSASQKRHLDKSITASDTWAICRIFKKTNTNAQRAVSHSWVSPLPETTTCTEKLIAQAPLVTHFTSQNISLPPKSCSFIQNNSNGYLQNSFTTSNFSPNKPHISLSNDNYNLPFSGFYSSNEPSNNMLLNMSSSIFEDFGIGVLQEQCDGFSRLPQVQEISENDEEQRGFSDLNNGGNFSISDEWGSMRSNSGVPLSLPSVWKSSSSPCPSESFN